MQHATETFRARPSGFRRFGGFWNALASYVTEQRDYARLEEMDDRMLKDMGISRYDIQIARREAAKAFYG